MSGSLWDRAQAEASDHSSRADIEKQQREARMQAGARAALAKWAERLEVTVSDVTTAYVQRRPETGRSGEVKEGVKATFACEGRHFTARFTPSYNNPDIGELRVYLGDGTYKADTLQDIGKALEAQARDEAARSQATSRRKWPWADLSLALSDLNAAGAAAGLPGGDGDAAPGGRWRAARTG